MLVRDRLDLFPLRQMVSVSGEAEHVFARQGLLDWLSRPERYQNHQPRSGWTDLRHRRARAGGSAGLAAAGLRRLDRLRRRHRSLLRRRSTRDGDGSHHVPAGRRSAHARKQASAASQRPIHRRARDRAPAGSCRDPCRSAFVQAPGRGALDSRAHRRLRTHHVLVASISSGPGPGAERGLNSNYEPGTPIGAVGIAARCGYGESHQYFHFTGSGCSLQLRMHRMSSSQLKKTAARRVSGDSRQRSYSLRSDVLLLAQPRGVVVRQDRLSAMT